MADRWAALREATDAAQGEPPIVHDEVYGELRDITALSAFGDAANPATIAALLQERDGYLDQHHRDSAELRRVCAERDEMKSERDALAAELERLREDGRRYRAIANVIHVDRISDGETMLASHWGAWVPGEHCDIDVAISAYADLRAIDAAREGK